MINIHLGMPRVGFRGWDFIGRSVLLTDPFSAHLLPQHFYRAHIRSAVNAGRSGGALIAEARNQLESFSHFDVLALSQPSLLGSPSDLLLSDRCRRRAVFRVNALSELFSDRRVCFHVMVINPANYLRRILATDAEEIILHSEIFSWANFLAEIGLLRPGHSLMIWEFSAETLLLEQFLCELLGQPLRYAGVEAEIIKSEFYIDDNWDKMETNPSIKKRLVEYENMYSADLDALQGIAGVRVRRKS